MSMSFSHRVAFPFSSLFPILGLPAHGADTCTVSVYYRFIIFCVFGRQRNREESSKSGHQQRLSSGSLDLLIQSAFELGQPGQQRSKESDNRNQTNVVLMVGLTAAGLEGTNSFTDSKGRR
jgi:hypothetical protein